MSDEAVTIELKAALLELLGDIRQAKDFAIEQAPDVVQQMVWYHGTMAWTCLVISVVLLSIWTLPAFAMRHVKPSGDITTRDVAWFVSAAAFLGGIVLIAIHLQVAIQATWAPKYFILNKIMAML